MMKEKDLLAVVYALEKFWPYIFGSKIIIYRDHATLKYLLSKKKPKPWLIWWALFLQEFDLKIKDKRGREHLVADHLSRLHIPRTGDINNTFLDEHLFAISSHAPWFAHIVIFLITESISEHWIQHQKDKFFHELKYYFWEEPLLLHLGYEHIIWRCVSEKEQGDILAMFHSSPCGGHFVAREIAQKILHSGFYWPTIFKNAYHFYTECFIVGDMTHSRVSNRCE